MPVSFKNVFFLNILYSITVGHCGVVFNRLAVLLILKAIDLNSQLFFCDFPLSF